MNVWIKVILICLMMIHQNLYAVEVERLYEVEVIANSEQQQDREAAIKQALKQLLLRILAGNEVLQDATVTSVLANAGDYVSEYQYSLAKAEDKNARLMRVLFDEERLINTLRPGKLALWNEIRPRTLVWLVVEQDGLQQFFDPDELPGVERAIRKASKQKKIPVLFPIQDLTEKRVLSIADVLSAYSEHLLEVSVRYEVVSTLAGKMVKQGRCWKGEWTLYFDAKIEQWSSPCSALDELALSGFQGVYDRLSGYYAAKPESTEVHSVLMNVSGIKRVSQLAQVSNYLETLPMVNTATWVSVQDGINIYRVFFQGSKDELNNTVVVGRVLKAEGLGQQNAKQLSYHFLKN